MRWMLIWEYHDVVFLVRYLNAPVVNMQLVISSGIFERCRSIVVVLVSLRSWNVLKNTVHLSGRAFANTKLAVVYRLVS